jgi:hypothetical protein
MNLSVRRVLLAVVFAAPAALVVAAGVKVRVEHDKTFDFTAVKSFSWHTAGAGEVKMLMSGSAARDPGDVQVKVEPTILQAVEGSLQKRGVARVEPGQGALQAHYYLLVGAGQSMQQMGQFLPGTTAWGVPPFSAQTTAHEVYMQGSLILDLSTPGEQGLVVYRGIAQTEIEGKYTDDQRRQRIADAIAKMFEKFPPKFKPPKQ